MKRIVVLLLLVNAIIWGVVFVGNSGWGKSQSLRGETHPALGAPGSITSLIRPPARVYSQSPLVPAPTPVVKVAKPTLVLPTPTPVGQIPTMVVRPEDIAASAANLTGAAITATVTATIESDTTIEPQATPIIVFSQNGHAFPIQTDLNLASWTHYHWDDSNAVDIEAAPDITQEQYQLFAQSKIIAVTSGTISLKNRTYGGKTISLYGDDSKLYYYAHLSEWLVKNGQRVKAGDVIGVIGDTGQWTRYLEVHLHFVVTSNGNLDKPNINAADLLTNWTGKDWIAVSIVDYVKDTPSGSPIIDYPWRITKTFKEHLAEGSVGAVDIDIDPSSPDYNRPDVDVHTTLTGRVNIIRWNPIYGNRVQVTNDKTKYTVVFSHLSEFYVKDFDTVKKGQAVGKWGETGISTGPHVDYMLFDPNSNPIDSTGSLYK